jgi:acyl-coenzyme A synthetase/AMP-(fatty) acid ligase
MMPGLERADLTIAMNPAPDGSLEVRTAQQLWAVSASLAKRLERLNVGTWLLASRNPWETLVASLATWSVPGRCLRLALPPNLLPATVTRLARQVDAGVLCGKGAAISEQVCASGLPTLQLANTQEADTTDGHAWVQGALRKLLIERISPQARLTLFTSGTTGEHQAIDKTLSQLLSEAELHATSYFAHTPGAAQTRLLLSAVVPHHIFGLLFGVLVPFSAAVPFFAADVEASLFGAKAKLATDLVVVPAQLSAWQDTGPQTRAVNSNGTTQRFFCSGAPLPAAVGHALLRRGAELVELFGSTETGGIASRHNDPGGLWRPLSGLRVDEADDGRLKVRSPFLSTPAEPLLTQDRIEWLGDGFRHLGRSDDVVKVGAKRVRLSDVEAFARSLPGVHDAVAIAVPTDGTRETAVWLVAATAHAEAAVAAHSERALRAAFLEHFDGVAAPRRIRVVDALPRGDTGKMTRQSVLALFEADSQGPPTPATREATRQRDARERR